MTLSLASIVFVFIGQFLNAVIVLIDKHIVTSTVVSRPSTYAFYVGLFSGFVLLILPFGLVGTPDAFILKISLIIGFTFITSIFFLFSALKFANATDVVSWLAAISTIATFTLSFLFLQENLPQSFPIALVLFLIGISMVGHFRFNARSFIFVVIAGILFGSSAVLLKILFEHTTFINGFFWSRMGNVIGALALLSFPSVRAHIFVTTREAAVKTGFLIVFNRILGGIAFIFILYAIRLGSVSVVNALSALQFFFVFVLVFLLMKKLPHLYQHEFRPGHILHKVMAMIFIAAGFFVLFL
jgi:drug/metabolite transporter (DMT)-like permease